MKRECGRCTLCCTLLGIPEIDKATMQPCPSLHKGKPGCCRQADKPVACQTYRCGWHQGAYSEDDRPDKLGYLIDIHGTSLGQVLIVHPSGRGNKERMEFLVKFTVRQHGNDLPVMHLDMTGRDGQVTFPTHWPAERIEAFMVALPELDIE